DFDPTDPRVVQDPYPVYAAMRAKCPVGHGSRFGGFHVLSRFADVYEAAHNPEVFSSAQGVTVPDFGNPMTAIPLEIDPPAHTRDDRRTRTVQLKCDGRPRTEDELLGITFLVAVAGHETTVGAIGALLLRLVEHPEVRAAIEARPELAFSAIEESMRLEPPI